MAVRYGLAVVAGIFVAAWIAGPAVAQGVTLTKTYDEDINVEYDNTVDVDIAKDIDVSKDIDYNGVVNITGNINVSESAVSVIDNKQIIDDGFVSVTGSDATLSNVAIIDGTVLGGAGGNIAVNLTVGDNNLQENVGILSAIGATTTEGAADAESFNLQKSINNDFSASSDAEVFNNTQMLGSVLAGAAGNVALNAATGAYNGQKNALAIAAVSGAATLSEATAAILQEVTFNSTVHNNTANQVTLQDSVANAATGNIGLNLAAGTNNLQQNTLAISSVQ